MSEDKWKKAKKPAGGGGDGDFPPTWDINKDPVIEGTYLSKKEKVGRFKSRVYSLKLTEDISNAKTGDKVDVWGSTVMDSQFDRGEGSEEEPKPIPEGSDLRIEFKGLEKEGTPNEYKMFEVLWIEPDGDEKKDEPKVEDL